jgi:hypothetical protein
MVWIASREAAARMVIVQRFTPEDLRRSCFFDSS